VIDERVERPKDRHIGNGVVVDVVAAESWGQCLDLEF
jgi:hypothetical protein